MKQVYKTINHDWLFIPTGDPFADAGGYALQEFEKRYPELDILELIMKATDIYVDRWEGKINPFFLNSKITQPAFNKTKKKEETCKYFLELLQNQSPSGEGVCRILGKKTLLFPAGRDNSILSGSGTLVNFHHSFESGILLSKEVIIRLHFLPFASELLQGKVAVIHSNHDKITALYAEKCCERNFSAIASNASEGILKSEARSPGTALFRFIDNTLDAFKTSLEEDNENYAIYLYHFTNFGASPDVQIFSLPFEVFDFYKFSQKAVFRQYWNSFVAGYYTNSDFKKAKYRESENAYIFTDKNSTSEIPENDFKYWRNTIYERLINGQTIIPHLLKRSRNNELPWSLIKKYAQNIRKMKKETVDKIEQMAEYILASNDERGITKAIKKLDGVKNSYLLRRFVLKDIVAKYYNEGNNPAIITIEDYADYLFPDTNSWQETRDVLLISIYQKLHERNIKVETEISDEEDIDDEIIE